MKEYFNIELVMTKEDNKNFKNSTNCWICDNDYRNNDVNVGDRCHITWKYRSSVHWDCNRRSLSSLENIKALDIEIVMSIVN